MAIIDDIISKASAAGKFVYEKTEDAVDYVSLEYKASTLRAKLDEQYKALGKLTYDAAKSGDDCAEACAKITAKIDGLMTELAGITSGMAKFKKVCPSCQSSNSAKSDYCSKCGSKL